MIPGVNFQPGAQSYGQQNGQGGPSRQQGSNQGVQEAIKVLSLRLPKVVGARAVAPAPLLTSQGSGGNPNVDSIVESVLSRMFPGQGSGPAPSAPMFAPEPSSDAPTSPMPDYRSIAADASGGGNQTSQPRFTGTPTKSPTADAPKSSPWTPPTTTPQIIVTPTHPAGDFSVGPDGRPTSPGYGASIIEPAPDLRQHFDWLPSPSYQQDVPLI